MRLRTVDLAGGGLKYTDPPDPATVSNTVVYTRFDPIPPPVVVLTDDLGEGESVERLVIRSDYTMSADQLSLSSDPILSKALKGRPYNPTCDRHLAPPKCALETAEAHGTLDQFMGAQVSDQTCDAGYNLSLREAGSMMDPAIVDVTTGLKTIMVPAGMRIVDVGVEGKMAIHPEPQLKVPYLPDPIARGTTFSGVPGAGSNLGDVVAVTLPANVAQSWGGAVPEGASDTIILKAPFSGTWPDTLPFRLRIAERPGTVPPITAEEPEDYNESFSDNGAAVWDAANRVLTVFLGKGQTVAVRYNSYPDITDVVRQQTPPVPLLGYLHWRSRPNDPASATPSPTQVLALAQFAAAGANWQITPFRELVLVHAVAKPLFPPAMVPLPADSGQAAPAIAVAILGQTTVKLCFTALFNELTTGKLDLFASWSDWLDDTGSAPDRPKQVSGSSHVAELRLEPQLAQLKVTNSLNFGHVHGLPGEMEPVLHHLPDTKFRLVNYVLRGTTAFREYFPAAFTADPANVTRDGMSVPVKVLNRARPLAPDVAYIVPTFGWNPPKPQKPMGPGEIRTSTRLGGGLRVYLNRPWYSSGAGELLGVVLRTGGTGLASESDPMKHVITTWGEDVINAAKAPPANPGGQGPAITDFSGYSQVRTKLTLGEEPSASQSAGWVHRVFPSYTQVDVVGYEVQFDEDRKLWYADILVNPGPSYWPFIRLALARFQPDSVAGAELSRVVLCDIMQLLPDRTLRVNASTDGKTLQIELQGVFSLGHLYGGPEFQFAMLQEKSKGMLQSTTSEMVPVIPNTGNDPVWSQPLSFADAIGKPIEPFTVLFGNVGSPVTGTIVSPEPIGSGKYRLVVREYEHLLSGGIGGTNLLRPTIFPTGPPWRLVYMDIVDM
jgi:hypothetical protein